MPDQVPPKPDQVTTPSRNLTRRGFGVLAGAAVVGGAVFAANWFNVTADAAGQGKLSVRAAHEAAKSGDVVLVDIRRPDEWERTGISEHAHAIDMRRDDFVDALLQATDGDRGRPVALICARGVRSRRMSEVLTQAGFSNILDVPEGMLGSGAGPGWLKSDLPVVSFSR